MTMAITLVLPAYRRTVSGGYRVVLEYAARLAERGHEVTLVMPSPGLQIRGWRRFAGRGGLGQRWDRVRHGTGIAWFDLPRTVRVLVPHGDDPRVLPAADVTIATAWHTAPHVADRPRRAGAGAYLIQHHETWNGPADRVDATWRLPLSKIVIARWLRDLADELDPGGGTAYVPNGIDLDRFRVRVPITARDPERVGMLVHPATWKATDVGIRALHEARERVPGLAPCLYGRWPRPDGLPPWVEYREHLDGDALVDYFNELAVYLHPSLAEGWPLPPAEAMACGAAVVAADNPGVLDYAVPDRTARVVPRGDSAAMAAALIDLVVDVDAREALAARGHDAIGAYTWDRAVTALEEHLVTLTGVSAA
ncbi:glycosyltransferase family 4 protein [Cellulomonas sp.]|uniref:glycosyltransferase family 4 protein n=1 Tax=Cellulomonas sp. TaxID=40001 RepID=UPI001B055A06|nr:glycosyltransferase family 4 protein [Cellulomonas sp.]MBO9553132.1 glycosyltransferase family 4 protein [Cellulomonas sp.]